jgi:hypothetical protein
MGIQNNLKYDYNNAYNFLLNSIFDTVMAFTQVTKEGLAARVVDEQQVARNFKMNELEDLLSLDEDTFWDPKPVPESPSKALEGEATGPVVSA